VPSPNRRFPPPWSVEETDACFIVRDHNGQALAYTYFEKRARKSLGGAPPHPRRSPAHRRQHRHSRKPASRPKPGGAFCGDSLRLNSEKH
jgi:hypothetical protein